MVVGISQDAQPHQLRECPCARLALGRRYPRSHGGERDAETERDLLWEFAVCETLDDLALRSGQAVDRTAVRLARNKLKLRRPGAKLKLLPSTDPRFAGTAGESKPALTPVLEQRSPTHRTTRDIIFRPQP
jgi:hypothetical protein